jgi:hypothetical protein
MKNLRINFLKISLYAKRQNVGLAITSYRDFEAVIILLRNTFEFTRKTAIDLHRLMRGTAVSSFFVLTQRAVYSQANFSGACFQVR